MSILQRFDPTSLFVEAQVTFENREFYASLSHCNNCLKALPQTLQKSARQVKVWENILEREVPSLDLLENIIEEVLKEDQVIFGNI